MTETTLMIGGRVHSPADPFATAMLVEGDTVAWVGTDGAAETHRDAADHVVELDGALVTPTFVDAHVHTSETGLALTSLDLSGTRSLAQCLAAVADWSRSHRGAPVVGHGWDETRWPEARPPRADELDRAAYGAPVFLSRVDRHSAVVSHALEAAAPEIRGALGWDESGRVERDAHHVARATIRAMSSPARRRELQRTALRHAAAAGIGMVHEIAAPHISDSDDLAGLLALASDEPSPEVVPYWGQLVADAEQARELADRLGVRGLAGDLSADGSLGSRTAALRAPYADAPHTCGHAYLSLEQVRDHVVACTQAGLQAGFHAIGDAAVATVLEGLRAARDIVGAGALRAARHRLEHVEMLDVDGVATLADLGVLASVQPAFDAAWGGEQGMYAERLGAERAAGMNPFAALARAGVALALGSDSPVTPLDPWGSVRAAAFHRTEASRLSVRGAFTAHTRGGWRAAGLDGGGVLAPGAPASYAVWQAGELVVQIPDDRVTAWSTDPRARVPGLPDLTPGTALPECLRTVVRGRVVYQREGALA